MLELLSQLLNSPTRLTLDAVGAAFCGSLKATLHMFLDLKYYFLSPSGVAFFAEPAVIVFPEDGNVLLATSFLRPDFFATDFFLFDITILFPFNKLKAFESA